MANKPVIKLKPKTTTIKSVKKDNAFTLGDFERLAILPEGAFYRPRKKQISIRIDVDVLTWFQAQPEKYQKLINQACRLFMRLKQMQ